MTPLNYFSRVLVIALTFVSWSTVGIVHAGRISSDPYADVDWQNDFRLKTQFHDHVRLLENRIASYDQAGYDVVSFMHYSGTQIVGEAWSEIHWPPEDWLSEEFLAGFGHIRFLLPNAELLGCEHVLSPLLTTYIEERGPSDDTTKQPHQYESVPEAIQLIRSLGGIPILAHPVGGCSRLDGYHAVEVYSANMAYGLFKGMSTDDRNEEMLAFWDTRLMEIPTVYGVAVNDWFGPWAADYPYVPAPPPSIVDSGKTIVISHEDTMSSFRDAVEGGAMLAVKDIGETKDRFPHIDAISVDGDVITVDTVDQVTWISNGTEVGTGSVFDTSTLESEARYLRAEITNHEGSTVYAQPWAIEPSTSPLRLQPGDADQDSDFDQFDVIQAVRGGKYLTGQAATWGEGDWNGAPGGVPGNPPLGDGLFNQADILSALRFNVYRPSSHAAATPGGREGDTDLLYLAVPEPSSRWLMVIGLAGLLAYCCLGRQLIGDLISTDKADSTRRNL